MPWTVQYFYFYFYLNTDYKHYCSWVLVTKSIVYKINLKQKFDTYLGRLAKIKNIQIKLLMKEEYFSWFYRNTKSNTYKRRL